LRHKWIQIEGGLLRCIRCGLTTKPYKVKKGGLPKCEPRVPDGEAVVTCPYCLRTVPNAQICIVCGRRLHPAGWSPKWLPEGGFPPNAKPP